MPTSTPLPRALARLTALLAGVLSIAAIDLPAAHATNPSVSLTLAAGQSGTIGRVVSNTDVTPVPTCDTGLSVSFDATMTGTVTVAPTATTGAYACSVDFQLSGQSTGLIEQVAVNVVPGLSIDDVTLREGSVGVEPGGISTDGSTIPPTLFTFTVTMSEPSTTVVTVAVATADGTATAEGTATALPDYTAVNTTLTFPPGVASQTVTVPVTREDTVEPDETFSVNLSAPTGAAITGGQGVGTILNDDRGPIRLTP
ncbi:MAG TPA: Calx-beta domain-containing protein [Mycobacteriales bacterium]|nr:Calx-beta domain-containing protein [Mycobacteriales bacterium]